MRKQHLDETQDDVEAVVVVGKAKVIVRVGSEIVDLDLKHQESSYEPY